MGRIWIPGGGGGTDLDVVTAAAGDVLQGKVIVGPDGEPLTGTLTLTGSAADSQVLAGKTYYNTDAKTKRTGTMVNRGAVAPSGLSAGGSYTIPEGYHNGSGKVTANSLASQTDANSGAGDILSGKTAWVKGSKVTGTMPNNGAVAPGGLNAGGSYTIPAGYHNGGGKVTANSLASQTGVQSGKTAAGAAQVLSGYEAWVNGGRVTGTMANQGAKTSSLNCGGSYTIPAGYHNGSGKITANSLSSQTSADAGAGDILTGKTAWVNGSKLTGTLATMAGQTITPSTSQQTVSCSGKKMTGNVVVNAIPSNWLYHTSGQISVAYNYVGLAVAGMTEESASHDLSEIQVCIAEIPAVNYSSKIDAIVFFGSYGIMFALNETNRWNIIGGSSYATTSSGRSKVYVFARYLSANAGLAGSTFCITKTKIKLPFWYNGNCYYHIFYR